ncbi:SCO family protein [Rhodocista pekingensis]|uniref:SCO family protein n=1 Tax=Rhodocista pekingensis TaxID=201185 RepID=A0ABW2KS94_9PROT
MTTSRVLRIAIGILAGLILAALVALWTVRQDAGRAGGVPAGAVATPGVTIGGDFRLVDETGREVTSADYAGRYRLIFFGFTFCPDICPTELQLIARALDALGSDAAAVQPLFVSIDPERDGPAQLAEYTDMFHPAIVGLTGTPEQVAAAARAFRVYYAKAPAADGSSYTMDHSTYTYLMGPDGGFLTVFPRGTEAGEIADAIRQYIRSGSR